jgi:hypothetical protein
MEAEPHDEPESFRSDERAAVVELENERDADPVPDRDQRGRNRRVRAVGDDLDPAAVRGEIKLVQGVEAHTTPEVARPTRSASCSSPGRSAASAGYGTPFDRRRPRARRAGSRPRGRGSARSPAAAAARPRASRAPGRSRRHRPAPTGSRPAARAPPAPAPPAPTRCDAALAPAHASLPPPTLRHPSRDGRPTSTPTDATSQARQRSVPATLPPTAAAPPPRATPPRSVPSLLLRARTPEAASVGSESDISRSARTKLWRPYHRRRERNRGGKTRTKLLRPSPNLNTV